MPSVSDILTSLKPSQLWQLGGAIVALLIGTFGFGVFVESSRSGSALLQKDTEIAQLKAEKSVLEETVKAAAKEYKDANALVALHANKAEFLNRYVDYLSARDARSERLFADYVCVMWKQAQERRLHFDREKIGISVEDLRRGVSPAVEGLLAAHGIAPGKLGKLRGGEEPDIPKSASGTSVSRNASGASVSRNAGRETRTERDLGRRLQDVRITKTVHFFDGSRYDVPKPIAIDVHTRSDCKAR